MGTYWENNGKHQETHDRLSKLVPRQGRAATMHGELLRCISNVYYDLFNNGLGNADTNKITYSALTLGQWRDEIVGTGEVSREEFDWFMDTFWDWHDDERGYVSDRSRKRWTEIIERVTDAVILVVDKIDRGD